MSGICGIIQLDGAPVAQSDLEAMVLRAAHRGADGIHYHYEGPVGMAGLTLDLTRDGSSTCRPVVNGEGQCLVADARLDNREDFRSFVPEEQFIQSNMKGFDKPVSDAVIIFHALLNLGEGAAERLLGDFAYAIWDAEKSVLTLSRDAMGMRSLYYRIERKRVIFATEICQILALSGVPRRLNDEALAWHLAGMQVPSGCVFYQGINEVKPSEEVRIDKVGRVQRRSFWRPNPAKRIRYRHEEEYVEHMRELLIEAVRCRLHARSPVGISLSGGIDSGTIASIAGWLKENHDEMPIIKAYSWAFSEFPECDERENTYRIAHRYGISVTEIAAEDTYPLVDYSAYIPHEDDPYTVMYQSFMAQLMSAAKKDDNSLLFLGVRGDVMSGGAVYDVLGMLKEGLWADAAREITGLAQAYQISPAASLSRFVLRPAISNMLPERISSLLRSRKNISGPRKFVADHVKERFLQRAGLPERSQVSLEARHWPGAARRQRYQHVFSPLVMRGVMELERTCSGYGLGFSDPWSDRRIAEFVLSCPQHMLNRIGMMKRMPRKALKGLMPADAIVSASKTSPEPLYLKALREKSYHTVVSLMTNSRSADLGCIDERAFRARFERFVSHNEPVFDIWPTLSLEIWLRTYW